MPSQKPDQGGKPEKPLPTPKPNPIADNPLERRPEPPPRQAAPNNRRG